MWFRHPPPPDRRAVAMQMVERKAELAPEMRTITVDGGGEAKASIPPAMAPLDFTVTYTVAEYASVLREHCVFEGRRRRRKGPQRTSWERVGQPLFGLALIALGIYWFDLMPPAALAALMAVLVALMAGEFILPFLVTVLAPLVYYVRQRPAGATCFSVDAAGFTRTSRLGAFRQTWDQVREVHAHPGADVLVLGKNWIPIPRRCLDPAQSELLRAYLDAWRGGHPGAGGAGEGRRTIVPRHFSTTKNRSRLCSTSKAASVIGIWISLQSAYRSSLTGFHERADEKSPRPHRQIQVAVARRRQRAATGRQCARHDRRYL